MGNTDTSLGEINLKELQSIAPHLQTVSEEGWVLEWGTPHPEAPEANAQPIFKVVCKNTQLEQVEKLDAMLSEAYNKAMAVMA